MTVELATLTDLKLALDLPSAYTSEDSKLQMFLNWSVELIETYLNRKLERAARTEYYNGTNTQKLLLKARPVITTPTIQVYLQNTNEGGFFGLTSGSFGAGTLLTYGEDYGLWIDQDDGTSRSGILIRRNSIWPKAFARQVGTLSPFVNTVYGNIKVVYTGGYVAGSIPYELQAAAIAIATKLRYTFPLGLEIIGESYEERSVSNMNYQKRNWLQSLARPFVSQLRNWKI